MENKCINCGATENLELHHVVPLALGGNDIESNKVYLCVKCHCLIHNKDLSMSRLATESINFKKAVSEGRVGRPSAKRTKEYLEAYKEWKEGKITAKEAMKRAGVSSATWYKMAKKENL